MKKFLTFFLTLTFLLGILVFPVSAASPYASDKEVTVPKIEYGSIEIDGKLDEEYSNVEMQELREYNLQSYPENPKNNSGEFWICYDEDFIYIYVDVQDKNIDYSNINPEKTWHRESIAVIFDFDYTNRDKEYAYSSSDNICFINLSGDGVAVTYHKYAKDYPQHEALYDRIKFYTVKQTEDNHILYELALPLLKTSPIEVGRKIGFEITAINAENGSRVGGASWSEYGFTMDTRTDVLGTAIFGESVYGGDNNDNNNSDNNNNTDSSYNDTSSKDNWDSVIPNYPSFDNTSSDLSSSDTESSQENNDVSSDSASSDDETQSSDNTNAKPNNSNKNNKNNSSNSQLHTTLAIVACILGAVIVLGAIAFVLYIIIDNSKRKKKI